MNRLLTALLALAAPLAAQVEIKQGTDRIQVKIDGKPFTDFFIGASAAKPYLHPLLSASGKQVTRSFPMAIVEGESQDHPHHRGLWFTHGDVNGIDFWANESSQKGAGGKKGLIVIRKVNDLKGGKKSGLIQTTFDWNGPDGKTLVSESRAMTFYSSPADRTIDFDITLKAVEAVHFGDTKEGVLAIRLTAALEEPEKKSLPKPARTGLMTDAEGRAGEKAVWGKRAPWVDYAGTLEGEALGVTIMDHPGNPKHPTYWHSRGYGLFAANIFGEHDFKNDKTADGGMRLQPGESLRFRYRVVIHPGKTDAAAIAAAYKKYAAVK